jgi:hypothetical protein
MTTRNPVPARHFGQERINIPLFTVTESSQFMLNVNPVADQNDQAELAAVKVITNRLGCLPLVLDKVAAYASSISSSYQLFLQHYDDFDRKLLFQQREPVSPYHTPIRTTWTMTLSKIDATAKMLMESLVFFDHDSVPLELLEAASEDKKCVPLCLLLSFEPADGLSVGRTTDQAMIFPT